MHNPLKETNNESRPFPKFLSVLLIGPWHARPNTAICVSSAAVKYGGHLLPTRSVPEGSLKPRRHECPPRICFYPIQPLYENDKFKNPTNNC